MVFVRGDGNCVVGEVAGVVVLRKPGCPPSFTGPITLVANSVVFLGIFRDADGPPRVVPDAPVLYRALLAIPGAPNRTCHSDTVVRLRSRA